MNRKDFLKGSGLLGLGLAVSGWRTVGQKEQLRASGGCVLIPAETAGPFPLDLTDNTFYFRTDVREDRIGSPHHLRMRIIGEENCEPMANVRVNIWHCDNEGNYSGYGTQVGTTYLRGYQMTDANGEVEFLTTFPGWYPGRVCHIHFQVFVNSSYSAVSQLTFDHDMTNQVYADNPELYPDGADPLSPDMDVLFDDGFEQQLASLEASEVPGDYDSFLEVTVLGSGTTVGVSHQERMTAQQLVLGQNFPNPFTDRTSIPIELKQTSQVTLDLWDPVGKKVKTMVLGTLTSGSHTVNVDFAELKLAPMSYLYQVSIQNADGVFKTVKRMTVSK